MLTQTSGTAIKALLFLTLNGTESPMSPREIAERIDASPTYLAKITRMLVKADILRSHRGAHGGVVLSREPNQITLLQVVEACQGLLIGNYCEGIRGHADPICAFHEAMYEVHQATVGVLSRWTIQELADRAYAEHNGAVCRMKFELNAANCDCIDTCENEKPGE
ncbi:MAG: Rrf2 family transcriptional regulator, nitric oxide-sensitive transcriptional repressor [Candidatus Sumerlaeota bacterium]|nr:Rrf2 family transcriptional regulator, nitric oxide-sensitive transcriptional repressor [Candidatus Sumerlaeota bacterium]